MNTDTIMFGLVAAGVVSWIAWAIIGTILGARRKRELYRQIEVGEVPVDYSAAVKEVATEQNNNILLRGAENEGRYIDLQSLRTKVARIRAAGYDAANRAREQGQSFERGLERNPYVKGSGSAKQWARGYCQLTGTHPKEWMQRA